MSSQSRVTPDRAVLVGLLLTAAIYCRDLKYDFLLDDIFLILMNQATVSWHNLKTIFTTDIFFVHGPSVPLPMAALHYRPIFMLWIMLNQQFFGSVFPWWHLTSLLLHICVVFLVYKLGVQVLKERWTAALAALLFAFHPIHVESVSYVSASTDLLVTLFLLISFLSYSRFREEGASAGYLAIAIFTAALAMLSKETGAMFPWLLIAYEALRETPPGTARGWKQFVWTLPFFAVVGIYAVVRTALFGRNLGPGPGGSRLTAFADAPLVLIAYLRNLLWSFRLSFFYPVEWGASWTYLKGIGVVLVAVIVTWLWIRYRDRPGVRLQLLWTMILFVPPLVAVSTFVKEDWVHDRHMYSVSVPFCLIVAALLTDPKLPRRASIVVSMVILLLLSLETAVQVPRFSDGISIFESALRVAPSNALAHRYYAFALYDYSRYEESFQEYRTTSKLWPRDPRIHGSFAEALGGIGRDEEAAAEYAKALELAPGPTPYRAFLLYRLATIAVKDSKFVEGEGYLREAVRIAPHTPSYHAVLAHALRQEGREQEADEQMRLEASIPQSTIRDYPTP
jgi:hypothetical protein